jgi:hypothetical protein
VQRPVSVIEATIDREHFRYLTIESVLETLSGLTAKNRYLASKMALWVRVKSLAADPRLDGRIIICADTPFITAACRHRICS